MIALGSHERAISDSSGPNNGACLILPQSVEPGATKNGTGAWFFMFRKAKHG
jgi:hypothetical protein